MPLTKESLDAFQNHPGLTTLLAGLTAFTRQLKLMDGLINFARLGQTTKKSSKSSTPAAVYDASQYQRKSRTSSSTRQVSDNPGQTGSSPEQRASKRSGTSQHTGTRSPPPAPTALRRDRSTSHGHHGARTPLNRQSHQDTEGADEARQPTGDKALEEPDQASQQPTEGCSPPPG